MQGTDFHTHGCATGTWAANAIGYLPEGFPDIYGLILALTAVYPSLIVASLHCCPYPTEPEYVAVMTDKVRLSRYSSLGLKKRMQGLLEFIELQKAVLF